MTADPLFDLTDATVVVTGACGSLGAMYCRALAARGANIVAVDVVDPTEALDVPGDRLLLARADVRDRAALAAALSEAEARFGPPTALINNAGLDAPPGASSSDNCRPEDVPTATWAEVLDVNLTGAFVACQVFGGAMARAGRGSIVNISSIYGEVSPDQRIYGYRAEAGAPFFKPAAYGASKAGLANLTRYLATHWAGAGVRVNTLTLGGVFAGQDPRFLAGYRARVPLGRMARAEEYCGAIIFLLSSASSYMTGANLVVDGGWTAW